MRQQIVIYKAKPEAADENQRLIERVFEELRAKAPTDMRYLSARLSDGTFVHVAFSDDSAGGPPAFTKLDSFQTYLAGIKDRVAAPPLQSEATIIGDYRMLRG
jgi:hypothetical protein